MIEIGSPGEPMDARYLRSPGGFAWWYVDLVTPSGDGLVLIWSYGLPFLPGYASSSRSGRPSLPFARPSVNLALYRGGREAFYLLQEHEPAAAGDAAGTAAAEEVAHSSAGRERNVSVSPGWSAGAPVQALAERTVRIGSSLFESRVVDGRCNVVARLDCAVPGTDERLTGTVIVDGAAARGLGSRVPAADAEHLWTPLTGPAIGTADLAIGGRRLARLEGRAYHDRNGGSSPLHSLGIRRWSWGRLPFGDVERIFYLLWPENGGAPRCVGLEIDRAGEERFVPRLEVEVGGWRRNLGGMRWPAALRLLEEGRAWLDLSQRRLVDSGPFYLRYFVDALSPDGERVLGTGETCEPDRVDRALFRPLVRMRVHRVARGNSIWLPLFSGPRGGRLRRLLRLGARRPGDRGGAG
jgi:carotenoid 1,2-hydratase